MIPQSINEVAHSSIIDRSAFTEPQNNCLKCQKGALVHCFVPKRVAHRNGGPLVSASNVTRRQRGPMKYAVEKGRAASRSGKEMAQSSWPSYKRQACVIEKKNNLPRSPDHQRAWRGRERIVIKCLLYVSRATPQMRTDVSGIDDILATARSRNQALGVTGALIFTQDNFAQLLEGPPYAIDQLMSSIKQDQRHTDVRTVCEKRDVTRRFEGWHMAYEGSSVFVARHVRVLAASFAAPSDAQTARLMDLMSSLSRSQS